ncbi:MAG: succinyl-CoA--3-ketoacid-CoA transferase [Firmicutes bacterium]|nr:succinyl-CoA--3-ketoacid-CoA transferase [Bacillota bacterium]
MSKEKEIIAKRVAQELQEGDVINLGIGLPTLVSNYVPNDMDVLLQSENGMILMGPAPAPDQIDRNIANAGAKPATILPGGAFFDSALSFSIIRGGHVDVTVLGALQIDETGSLASHIVPGQMAAGMGGAMDLIAGSKKVIIATTHTVKDGVPKILKRCTLPLTAVNRVNKIITELAVMEVHPHGLVLTELAEGVTADYVQERTEAKLHLADTIKTMQVKDA